MSCSKEQLANRAVVDCKVIAGAKILPEDDLPCSYNMVYSYRGELYTHCVCCACFRWIPPVNCEGEVLCEFPDDCWREFLEEAEYLYAIEEICQFL